MHYFRICDVLYWMYEHVFDGGDLVGQTHCCVLAIAGAQHKAEHETGRDWHVYAARVSMERAAVF